MSPDEITLETLPESLTSHYSSQDGRTRVEIFPAENVEENQALRRFVLRVQQKAPRAIGSPVSILEGGQTIIDACIQATILAIVASALLLLVVLRRLGETLFVLLPLVLTLLLTVATCLALGIPLNLANVIALPLVLGLGIAFGIYLILRRRGSRLAFHCRGVTEQYVSCRAFQCLDHDGFLRSARVFAPSGHGQFRHIAGGGVDPDHGLRAGDSSGASGRIGTEGVGGASEDIQR